MSERYSRLFTLPENLYTEGSPLLIKAGALLKDNQTGKVLAQFKFSNISAKTVKAVFVSVTALDIANNALKGIEEYQYLDLAAPRSNEFGQKNAVHLPDSNTRTITCKVIKVFFADNSVWEAPENANWESLKEKTLRKPLEDYELEKQFHIEYGENFKYEFEAVKDLWYCTCGAINHNDEALCHKCTNPKTQYTKIDLKLLEKNKVARIENEQKEKEAKSELEKQIVKDKQLKAKRKKLLLIIILITVAVLTVAYFFAKPIITPIIKYNNAVKTMKTGEYDEAISIFEELGDYEDSTSLILDCRYNRAISLMDEGYYEEAITEFNDIRNYFDTADYIKECKYRNAKQLMNDKSYYEAVVQFKELTTYKDSKDLYEQICAIVYNEAAVLISNKEYDEALELLSIIRGYEDVDDIEVTLRFNGKWTDKDGKYYYYIDIEDKSMVMQVKKSGQFPLTSEILIDANDKISMGFNSYESKGYNTLLCYELNVKNRVENGDLTRVN